MRLLAIHKFLWRGDEYLAGAVFDTDAEAGARLVAEGHAAAQLDSSSEQPAANLSEPVTEPDRGAVDSPAPTVVSKKSKKKKA